MDGWRSPTRSSSPSLDRLRPGRESDAHDQGRDGRHLGRLTVRIVVALGGNALLRRGQKPDAEVQEANVAIAVPALASLTAEHELVVTHGNGPQVGVLALQSASDPNLPRRTPSTSWAPRPRE